MVISHWLRVVLIIMKDLLCTYFLALIAIAFCACSDSELPTGGEDGASEFVDSRDSQIYKTVEIGGRVWMAENLNYYDADDSLYNRTHCFKDSASYCEKQGRLYAWNVAMVACPAGWELPSMADFDSLLASVGGGATAADSLSARGFINDVKGGYYFIGYSSFFDEYAYFWTRDEVRANNARSVILENGRSSISYDETYEEFGLSVRCIKKQ